MHSPMPHTPPKTNAMEATLCGVEAKDVRGNSTMNRPGGGAETVGVGAAVADGIAAVVGLTGKGLGGGERGGTSMLIFDSLAGCEWRERREGAAPGEGR